MDEGQSVDFVVVLLRDGSALGCLIGRFFFLLLILIWVCFRDVLIWIDKTSPLSLFLFVIYAFHVLSVLDLHTGTSGRARYSCPF